MAQICIFWIPPLSFSMPINSFCRWRHCVVCIIDGFYRVDGLNFGHCCLAVAYDIPQRSILLLWRKLAIIALYHLDTFRWIQWIWKRCFLLGPKSIRCFFIDPIEWLSNRRLVQWGHSHRQNWLILALATHLKQAMLICQLPTVLDEGPPILQKYSIPFPLCSDVTG